MYILYHRRSGHSFCLIGDYAYLFGGNDFRRPPGPNNELYKLDMSGSEFYWSKVENSSGRCPEPRSDHTAIVYNNTKMLVFGGFRSSHTRYQDVWILDSATDEWSQPLPGTTEVKDNEVIFKRNWPDVPAPRGAHTCTLIGGNQMYVFGGYGGSGFARKDFNDITVLDLDTWEWRHLETSGEVPPARSGHQAVAIQDKIYVIGGWNSIEQLNDMYMLDTVTNVWTKLQDGESEFGPKRWNLPLYQWLLSPNGKSLYLVVIVVTYRKVTLRENI